MKEVAPPPPEPADDADFSVKKKKNKKKSQGHEMHQRGSGILAVEKGAPLTGI